jgi:fatty acid CoA ligase FadD9
LSKPNRYLGQINTTDFFTRLLCGIHYTGIAPATFYTLPHGPEEHFDGMPIDFVAGVIAATASAERNGFGTYHVVNPHWDDGISLDRIVDWVASAGYPVKRIEDYGQWYAGFKAALGGLPPGQQQASPLPIIYQWERPTPGKSGTKYDATQLRKRAAQLTEWRDVPHLDEAFIHTNLKHLVMLGLISPPPLSNGSA